MNDINTFKQKLENGGYSGITGARRAIGKFQGMTDADRAKMLDMATKHFGDEEAPVAKTAKKAPAVKAVSPTAVATPDLSKRVAKKTAAKKVVEETSDTVVAPAPKATRKKAEKEVAVASHSDAFGQVEQAERTLQSISRATAELLRISEANVDVKAELTRARVGINAVLRTLVDIAEKAAPAASAVPVQDSLPITALTVPT